MISKFKLFENPDTVIYDDGLKATSASMDSRPFGYAEVYKDDRGNERLLKYLTYKQNLYKDKSYLKMLVGKMNRYTHWDMFIPGKPMESIERQHYIYPGRLWEQKKIISFWQYPKGEDFETVIKDIEKASGLNIWNDDEWRVEVVFNRKGRPYDPHDFRWNSYDDPARGMHDVHLIKLKSYSTSDDFDQNQTFVDFKSMVKENIKIDKKYKDEYNTPEELVKFVIGECGDMKYDYWGGIKAKYVPETNTLSIHDSLDIEKVYLLDVMMRQLFGKRIDVLYIDGDENLEIPDGFLDKMGMKELHLPRNIKNIPKLPRTLRKISKRGVESVISKDGSSWRILKQRGNLGRFYANSLDDCLRAIEDGTYKIEVR